LNKTCQFYADFRLCFNRPGGSAQSCPPTWSK